MTQISIDAFRELIGSEVGLSDWFAIDQQRIDTFADVTNDHQYIHVDEVRAKSTAFGGTIAHGYLTLSMLSALKEQVVPDLENTVQSVNYGFDKLRFLAPVPSGSFIRGRFVLSDFIDKGQGAYLIHFQVTVEIKDIERPALIADWLVYIQTENQI